MQAAAQQPAAATAIYNRTAAEAAISVAVSAAAAGSGSLSDDEMTSILLRYDSAMFTGRTMTILLCSPDTGNGTFAPTSHVL
jgi:hypothetical protein